MSHQAQQLFDFSLKAVGFGVNTTGSSTNPQNDVGLNRFPARWATFKSSKGRLANLESKFAHRPLVCLPAMQPLPGLPFTGGG